MPFVALQDFADHTSAWLKQAQAGSPVVVMAGRTAPWFACVYDVPADTDTERLHALGAEFVATRDLSRKTHEILGKVRDDDQLTIVTFYGKPKYVIESVDADALAAAAIGRSPALRESMAEAERDLAAGRTRTLDQFIDRLSE
jgi:PHD/YefM family antitoxin component YafN of YafNO toxin-antitoxin module